MIEFLVAMMSLTLLLLLIGIWSGYMEEREAEKHRERVREE